MISFEIKEPTVNINLLSYNLSGKFVNKQVQKLEDIYAIFKDQKAYKTMDSKQTVYTVQSYLPVAEGTEGGLFWGLTTLMPGKVGNEYFMTKGHFHSKANRAEFYWSIQGGGILIMMDMNKNTWIEKMYPGSLHYIPGYVAHRVVNTKDTILIFGACWPSDSGHDYSSIAEVGFPLRLLDIDGKLTLVKN